MAWRYWRRLPPERKQQLRDQARTVAGRVRGRRGGDFVHDAALDVR
jgi:hypothetical protein